MDSFRQIRCVCFFSSFFFIPFQSIVPDNECKHVDYNIVCTFCVENRQNNEIFIRNQHTHTLTHSLNTRKHHNFLLSGSRKRKKMKHVRFAYNLTLQRVLQAAPWPPIGHHVNTRSLLFLYLFLLLLCNAITWLLLVMQWLWPIVANLLSFFQQRDIWRFVTLVSLYIFIYTFFFAPEDTWLIFAVKSNQKQRKLHKQLFSP